MQKKKKFNVCMLVHEYYPKDFRVRREAESLENAGYNISIIALKNPNERFYEIINNIEIYRMPVRRHRGAPLFAYLFEYLMFLICAGIKLTLLHCKKNFKIVHIHNPPDFLVFAAIIPKLTGAKIIIDIHDKISKLYQTRFNTLRKHCIIRLIKSIEKISAAFADGIITAVNLYKKEFIDCGVSPEKIEVILNTADERYFTANCIKNIQSHADISKNNHNCDHQLRLFHHGTLVKRYGLDVLINAAYLLKLKNINFKLDIYGEGDYYPELKKLVALLKLEDKIFFHGFILLDFLADKISEADLCIVPNRKDLFMDTILPTKLLEYIIMDKPVIISRTDGVTEYFDDSELTFVEPGSAEELYKAILMFSENKYQYLEKIPKAKQKYLSIEWKKQSAKLINFYNKWQY